jgi:hypothetical protein
VAIGAAAVWRARPGGNAANGAIFDATLAGAGTDYSQQDGPQLTLTDLAAAGSTAVVTSVTGGFTAAMVGNALRLASGTNAAVGYYFIIIYTNTNTVTLDRNPGTVAATAVSGGNCRVGGAYGGSGSDPLILNDSTRATGNKMVAGNSCGVYGSSGVPASPDYSFTGTAANPPTSGDTTGGAITFFGEGPNRPILYRSDAEVFYVNGGEHIHFKNMYFRIGAGSANRMFDTGAGWYFESCTFDLNDQDSSALVSQPCVLLNCEFLSKTSGTPTSRTTSVLAWTVNLPQANIMGCNFHDLGGPVCTVNAATIMDCRFYKCVKEFILCSLSDNRANITIRNNTFDSGSADAVSLTTAIAVINATILDNIFSNNLGSSKTALKLTGTTALNDRMKMFLNYNDYYNNTANVSGFTIGAQDLTLDPQYTSSTDQTLNGTNLQAQAYPRATITGG